MLWLQMNMRCFYLVLAFVCFTDILGTSITSGDQYSLECLGSYISTITCYLNISAEPVGNNSTYWLRFNTIDEHYNCSLERKDQSMMCTLDLQSGFIFSDTDSYSIFLHSGYHGNNFSELLDVDYVPKNHIRPVTPCNVSLFWDQDGAVVQWESGYDSRHHLVKSLQYQLRMYSQHSGMYEVNVMEQKVFVEESIFKRNTNYTINVRSKPNGEYYKGVWSQWTPALHWRRDNIINNDSPDSSFHSIRYLLLVPISLVLLLCILYSRCRKPEYVPSPASYLKDWKADTQIHTLLSGKVRDILKGEESLQIDVLTENEDKPLQQSPLDYEMTEMTNEHKSTPQSPSMLCSPEGSEVDSGCWIRDVMAMERGSITCSEGYCTLSNSQNNI